jgi:hypothetical protein
MSREQLFSIDVDAHLKKAASHTFGSPAHYPVELVRAALRRNAKEVIVSITRNHIKVQDNGKGLSAGEIKTLNTIMDPHTDESEKELAVESLQTREGLGLLAIFASQPTRVVVENNPPANNQSPCKLHFNDNRLEKNTPSHSIRGTILTIYSKHRDREEERKLLTVFCNSVVPGGRIKVNNQPIGGEALLNRQMATLEIPDSKECSGGLIGIPRKGMLCHLRLLDCGIPWHHITLAPRNGFVFDAAIEFTSDSTDIPEVLMEHLLKTAARLYRWLCKRYSTAAPYHQDRIEELIFLHCRNTGDLSLLHQFAPFKLYDSLYSLDLTRVREKISSGALYAVPRKKENLYYNTGSHTSKTILSLTREQADLLINYLKLPVVFLSPIKKKNFRWRNIRDKFSKLARRTALYILPIQGKIIPSQTLNKDELHFLDTMNRYLKDHPGVILSSNKQSESQKFPEVMLASRRFFPLILVRSNISIARKHPLIKKAIVATNKDPRNIEMVVPLLQK